MTPLIKLWSIWTNRRKIINYGNRRYYEHVKHNVLPIEDKINMHNIEYFLLYGVHSFFFWGKTLFR
jgi:hypothetical protein